MSLTITQARDDVFKMLRDALQASSFSGIRIKWEDAPADEVNAAPDGSGSVPAYLMVSMTHYSGGQTSLGPRARHERKGLLRVEIRTQVGSGMSVSDELSQLVLDTYEGHHSARGVWFRNCRLQEMGADGNWSRVDVMIDFTYTQVK